VILDMDPHHLTGRFAEKDYREARTSEFVAPGESLPSPSAAASTHAEEVLGNLEAACDRLKHWEGLHNPKPPPWFASLNLLDNAPSNSFVLYLHGLHAGSGPERLVVLHADEYFGGPVSLYSTVFIPAGLTGELVTLQSRPVRSDTRLQAKGLHVFAGQLDPADPSRFTLDYENAAGKGTIELRLLPDNKTQLNLLNATSARSTNDPVEP
jgi:hypothetical protein